MKTFLFVACGCCRGCYCCGCCCKGCCDCRGRRVVVHLFLVHCFSNCCIFVRLKSFLFVWDVKLLNSVPGICRQKYSYVC